MESKKKNQLESLVRDEKGAINVRTLIAIATTPLCAYIVSYLGEGFGYIEGVVAQHIPLVNQIAPYIAERTGLILSSQNAVDLNPMLYSSAGALMGFLGGATVPWRILIKGL